MCSDETMIKIGELFDAIGDVFLNVLCISAIVFASWQLKAPELAVIATAIVSLYAKYLERKDTTPKKKTSDKGQFSLKQCLPTLVGYFIFFK